MRVDLHVHTEFSCDSEEKMELLRKYKLQEVIYEQRKRMSF